MNARASIFGINPAGQVGFTVSSFNFCPAPPKGNQEKLFQLGSLDCFERSAESTCDCSSLATASTARLLPRGSIRSPAARSNFNSVCPVDHRRESRLVS
jgi:hypothetical protein